MEPSDGGKVRKQRILWGIAAVCFAISLILQLTELGWGSASAVWKTSIVMNAVCTVLFSVLAITASRRN